MENQFVKTIDLKVEVDSAIQRFRSQYPEFENAHDTYSEEYGKQAVTVNEPSSLCASTDPVILILGRNCVIHYFDSRKELAGSLGKIELKAGSTCIIGRRQPQDSKLVTWSPDGEVEIGEYNPRAGIIPSRVHAAIVVLSETESYFTDLSSSSGTVLVGDSIREGQFVRVYDPGSPDRPRIGIKRISMSRKS